MEELFARLRRFYMLVSAPSLAFFALAYFTADEPLVEAQTRYLMLVILYGIALFVVPGSSMLFRRALRKSEGLDEVELVPLISKHYKIRIWALNAISYLCCPFYIVTVEQGCCYMFAIVSIVTLLSYPTQQYLIREKD